MTESMETICGRTCDALVEEILSVDGEYVNRLRYLEGERARLCAELDVDTAMRINDLLDERAMIGEVRENACFRAGFQLAVALGR